MISPRIPAREKKAPSRSKITLSEYPTIITNRAFGVTADMLRDESAPTRVVVLSGGGQVGQAGMARDAEFDLDTGCVCVIPGKPATAPDSRRDKSTLGPSEFRIAKERLKRLDINRRSEATS